MVDLVKECYSNLLSFTQDEMFMQKLKKALNYVNLLDFSSRSHEVLKIDIRYWYQFYNDSSANQEKIKDLNKKLNALYVRATDSSKSLGSIIINDDVKEAKCIINILGDMVAFFGEKKKSENVDEGQVENIELLNFIRIHYQEINSFIKIYKENDKKLKDTSSYIDTQKEEVNQAREKFIKDMTSNAQSAINESQKAVDKVVQDFESKTNEMQKQAEALNKQLLMYTEMLTNDVQRELLAKYFEKERIKLKGNLNLKVIIIPFIILLILHSSGMSVNLGILKTILIYVASFIIVQIGSNLLSRYENKQKDKANELKNDENSKTSLFNITLEVMRQHTLEALFSPYWCWLAGTFLGMFCIMGVAIGIIFVSFQFWDNVTYQRLLPFSPLCLVLIWVTWFCSKHFSYTKQVCDEYEYKYALSKSYLGYRQEAELLAEKAESQILLSDLMRAVIINIARSPVQSVKSDSNMPISEILQTVKDITQESKKS